MTSAKMQYQKENKRGARCEDRKKDGEHINEVNDSRRGHKEKT